MKVTESVFIKIITTGDGGVGKTTLLHRYVEGVFLSQTQTTLGVEFIVKELKIGNLNVMIQLWDFGGQEHFRHLLQRYALGAKGAIIMFDLTRRNTLDSIEEWVEICRKYDSKLPIIFLGSKLDLIDKITVIDDDVLLNKTKFNFLKYLKVSSKTGENVQKAFEILIKKVLQRENMVKLPI